MLDGSLSTGRTGGELVYHWSQVLDQQGAKDVSVIGTLSDNHSPTASRVSFSRTEGRGLYVFTLQVEDRESGFRSDVDTLYVLVTSTPPEVSILEPPAYWRWDYR